MLASCTDGLASNTFDGERYAVNLESGLLTVRHRCRSLLGPTHWGVRLAIPLRSPCHWTTSGGGPLVRRCCFPSTGSTLSGHDFDVVGATFDSGLSDLYTAPRRVRLEHRSSIHINKSAKKNGIQTNRRPIAIRRDERDQQMDLVN